MRAAKPGGEHMRATDKPGGKPVCAEKPADDRINARELAMLSLMETENAAAYSPVAIRRQLRRAGGAATRAATSVTTGAATSAAANAPSRDAALTRELVYGVTKWKLTLDSIIFRFSNIKADRVAFAILTIIRLGAYQIIFSEKIRASAACDESVKLAKKYGNAGSVGYVNALLRKISGERSAYATSGEYLERVAAQATERNVSTVQKDSAAYLSVRYSYPEWLCKKWTARYGGAFAEALMDAGNRRPELTVRVNATRADPAGLAENLRRRGFTVRAGRFANNALIIENPGDFSNTPEFENGLFTVQDESSMLCVQALDPKPGESIFDACAAPGGKCGYIAEITDGAAAVLAADIRPARVAAMEQNIAKTGLKSIKCAVADSAAYDSGLAGAMDKILLDAPCSGFGVIRKKPEIKWTRTQADVNSLAETQAALLANTSRYLKTGGALIYSVCTIEPEECEDIVRNFLDANGSFEAEDLRPYLPRELWPRELWTCDNGPGAAKNCGIYIYPHMHGIDGFYIARLRRVT